MTSEQQFSQIKELLDPAQSVLVIIDANPDLDVLAASSSLFLSLEQAGKEVLYASPDLPTLVNENLVGVDRVKTDISNKNLVVSFDYNEAAVEKVSYHIGEETNRFYLTVQPKKGQQPLDKNTVELGYSGAEADLIFLIGVHDYESLEQLHIGNEQLFSDTTVVTIHSFEPQIGNIKFNTSEYINMSSAVAILIRQLGLNLSADAATNLLLSIEETTNSFQSLSTTAEVFETSAWLMKRGARRVRKPRQQAVASVKPVQPKSKPQQIKKISKKSKPHKQGKNGGLDHQPGMMGKSS